jgi:hypothetical protein
MPSIIFDDTLTDSGSSVLGGTRVLYVAWEVTVEGPAVHRPYSWDPLSLLGVGFWQLGNDLTPGGLISGVGWNEPHWMYTTIGQWVTAPALVGTEFGYSLQQYVQWVLTPVTEVHLIIFGDV